MYNFLKQSKETSDNSYSNQSKGNLTKQNLTNKNNESLFSSYIFNKGYVVAIKFI